MDYASAAYSSVSAAIVVNAKTGEIIYSYNSDVQTPPASLVKMMTLLLVFKTLSQRKISPTTKVLISPNAASQSPCTLGLKAGKTISVRSAILALITKSANDVAVALAECVGKSENDFVAMMNREAQRLGMGSTVFFNPSGWKNPGQLSTAADMARLARALLQEYPNYYHLFSTRQFFFNNQRLRNHNELLGRRDGMVVDGIKTGFLNSSGFNLAASAVNGKNRLIVVVFGGKTPRQRDAFASLLLRKGFCRLSRNGKNSSMRRLMAAGMASRRKIASTNDVHGRIHGCGIYNKIYGSVFNRGVQIGQHKTNQHKAN
jgi:D-alanyl-D-alanine carboxypeptidase